MRGIYRTAFVLAGAGMIWYGVKLLIAALSAAALLAGAALVFVGMRVIARIR
jgi:hypothetical protein